MKKLHEAKKGEDLSLWVPRAVIAEESVASSLNSYSENREAKEHKILNKKLNRIASCGF